MTDLAGLKDIHAPQEMSQVMFVLDVTQSMAAEIVGTKESIKAFIAMIAKQQLRVEVGLTWFRDIMYDQRPGTLEFADGVFTSDAHEFISQVDALKAYGGGGNPYESSKHGLLIACKNFTRKDTRRFMVLVTDQRPYPDGKGNDPSSTMLVAYLKRCNIDQLYCVIRKRWEKEFECITQPTSAKVFNLVEDGRSAEAFGAILNDIGQSITTYMRRL